jgi:hypothetical protein
MGAMVAYSHVTVLNPLKPIGNRMSHLLYQSAILHFALRLYLRGS